MHAGLLCRNLKSRDRFGRSKHKLKDNIKMDNEEIEQESVECIYLAQDMVKLQAVVDTVINFQVP